jgi:hypothetical protein
MGHASVTSEPNERLPAAPAERVRDRLLARLRARQFDSALAAGISPATRAPIAIRARALVGTENRRALAASLRRAAGGGCGRPAFGSRVTPSRAQIAGARPDVERLARRLAGADPVDARGVALTRGLLSDGAGPLFWARSPESLRVRLREALDALEPGA